MTLSGTQTGSLELLQRQQPIDDGLCMIQPIPLFSGEYGRAFDVQVAGAARRSIGDCKIGGSLQGGVAYKIGVIQNCYVNFIKIIMM